MPNFIKSGTLLAIFQESTHKSMKLTKYNIRDIRLIAKDMQDNVRRIEVGERWLTDLVGRTEYYNRLHRLDDESDLSDTIALADLTDTDFEIIDGKLLLDFYLYSNDAMLGNMLIMLDESNSIISAHNNTYSENNSYDIDHIINPDPARVKRKYTVDKDFDKRKRRRILTR